MSWYDEEDLPLHVGDITKPGFDFRCQKCLEIFIVHYSRDNKPIAVTCPVCRSGLTNKIICAPATKVRWKDARSASDASDLRPRYHHAARNRALGKV